MSKNFFYRLNNLMILAIIVFGGFLIYSRINTVSSQNSPQANNPITTSVPAYIINRELDVNINPGEFTAQFKSDGISAGADDKQKARFVGDNPELDLIDIPIKFQFQPENSKLILPGEIVYPVMPRGTAPLNYKCSPLGSNGQPSEEDRLNCLYGVTMTSVFTDMETSTVTIGQRQFKVVQNDPTFYESLTSTIRSYLDNFKGAIVSATGLPDQGRSTVGTIRFWGDDNFQQFVPISSSKGSNQPILVTTGKTKGSAVNQDEGLFATELSQGIDSKISSRYKSANIVEANLKVISGPGDIYEPFTAKVNDNVPEAPPSGFIDISKAILQKVTQTGQKFKETQIKLAAQVTLRPLAEAEKYGVKFKVCDAFIENGFDYSPYPNPIKKEVRTIISNDGKRIIGEVCSYKDLSGKDVQDGGCQMYERYSSADSIYKKCITGIEKHSGKPDVAKGCALQLAQENGCDEFSVEEDGLNLSMMEHTFPIGMGAYFQNAVLNDLNPSDTTGPYLNYLSPYFCSKLNLSYKLKRGKDYIYDINVKSTGVNSGKLGGPTNFQSADVVNQYCVIGGIISNFAWAMTQQQNHYGRNNPAGVINLPKEALTCDKKEIAIFGATPVKSNIYGGESKPYYIMDDNSRGENGIVKKLDDASIQDEVALYHGYNAYPLTPFYSDSKLKDSFVQKYSSLDSHIVTDPKTGKPKYIVASFAPEKNKMSMFLCKFPSDRTSYKAGEKSLCTVIDEGGFLFPAGVSMVTQTTTDNTGKSYNIDTVTVIYRQPGKSKSDVAYEITSKQGDGEKEELPFVYRFIDVISQNDISSSILSDQFELPYLMNVDVLQLSGGQVAVGGISFSNKTISEVSLTQINPLLNSDSKVEFIYSNEASSNIGIKSIKRVKNNISLSSNLCTTTGQSYCVLMNNLAFVNTVKIAQDTSTNVVYLVMISGGFGTVYPFSLSAGLNQSPTPGVFAYNKSIFGYNDEYDAISAMKVNGAGELDIFLERSGAYLNIVPQSKIRNTSLLNSIEQQCGTNCLVAFQKQFDYSVFDTDCSDYGGAGSCGYPKLKEIKSPVVFDFVYSGSGKILAWYRYKGIDKTLFQSPDLLYSYSGLYKEVGALPPNEFSNAYIPVKGKIEIKQDDKTKSIDGIYAKPIRFNNYAGGGFIIGRELQDRAGKVFEAANMNPEKLNCKRIYASQISGIDLYFGDTGLIRPGLNPVGSASSPVKPIDSPVDAGARTSINSGEYCEEKWCIPDEVAFVGNPKFAGDKNNEALKASITRVTGAPRSYVDRVCNAASERNVSCAVIAAIWKTESGAKTTDAAFGCFLNDSSFCKAGGQGYGSDYCTNWYTFDNQVKCTVNSIINRYNEYQPTIVLSGPSDRAFGPYLTNLNRGGGACVAATRFSYVFQKYTPIDKRINNDNQCNRGLVERIASDGSDPQEKNCNSGTIMPHVDARDNTGKVVKPDIWPDITKSRIGLQRVLMQMDVDGSLNANNSLCFPNKNNTGDNSTGSQEIAKTLEQYDTSITQTKGRFKMNLAGWGNDDAAGNIYMALAEDWNRDGKGNDMQGAFVIKPGESWSFNDRLNNLQNYLTADGKINMAPLEQKYAETKAPWLNEKFDYESSKNVAGGGWCELATTIRMAADRVKAGDGKFLEDITFSGAGNATPPSDTSYGTSSGWKGGINHWTHSGVTAETFNQGLSTSDGDGTYRLEDASKYVSIWLRPSKSDAFNDGDLFITNPYGSGSGIDMILTIQIDNKGMVTVEVLFGKKKTGGAIPSGPN